MIFRKTENILHRFVTLTLMITMPMLFSSCFALRMVADNTERVLFAEPDKVKNKIANPIRSDVKLSALWIGHSSVLLQIEDKVILIDPVFDEVIGGLMLRNTEAGLDLDDLPKLDMVIVSHAHMDHLSINTLDEINDNKKFKGAKLVFPRGVEQSIPDYPELDLVRMETGNTYKKGYVGETKEFDGLKVTTVFTSHYGGRFGFDSYLWHMPGCTGYVIEYKGKTIFYPGDTVYDEEAFKEIGKKFDIDLALIPIGPCKDCFEVNSYNHVTSMGALKILEDVRADYMIPVHYGALTYRSDANLPLTVLKELMVADPTGSSGSGNQQADALSKKVIILDEGQQHVFE
jgi:L-ascorbate metabolism protein UlaG (beta-lactamase superfamily)